MKQGKYEVQKVHHSHRGTRVLAIAVALMLLVCSAIGGTIAWLTSTSDPVTGTFVVGDITVELSDSKKVLETKSTNAITTAAETTTYTPGTTIETETAVTVAAGSEACFLFIHIEESNNMLNESEKVIQWSLKDLITTENKNGVWTAVPNHSGYYYVSLSKVKENTTYYLFTDNKLTVNSDITESPEQHPSIKISVAAVQSENIPDGNKNNKIGWKDGWLLLPSSFTGENTSK